MRSDTLGAVVPQLHQEMVSMKVMRSLVRKMVAVTCWQLLQALLNKPVLISETETPKNNCNHLINIFPLYPSQCVLNFLLNANNQQKTQGLQKPFCKIIHSAALPPSKIYFSV